MSSFSTLKSWFLCLGIYLLLSCLYVSFLQTLLLPYFFMVLTGNLNLHFVAVSSYPLMNSVLLYVSFPIGLILIAFTLALEASSSLITSVSKCSSASAFLPALCLLCRLSNLSSSDLPCWLAVLQICKGIPDLQLLTGSPLSFWILALSVTGQSLLTNLSRAVLLSFKTQA